MHMHSLKLFETSKVFHWIKSQIALKNLIQRIYTKINKELQKGIIQFLYMYLNKLIYSPFQCGNKINKCGST